MPGFSGFVAICVGGCNTIVLNGILSGWFVMFFWFLPCVCGCYTVANVFWGVARALLRCSRTLTSVSCELHYCKFEIVSSSACRVSGPCHRCLRVLICLGQNAVCVASSGLKWNQICCQQGRCGGQHASEQKCILELVHSALKFIALVCNFEGKCGQYECIPSIWTKYPNSVYFVILFSHHWAWSSAFLLSRNFLRFSCIHAVASSLQSIS